MPTRTQAESRILISRSAYQSRMDLVGRLDRLRFDLLAWQSDSDDVIPAVFLS